MDQKVLARTSFVIDRGQLRVVDDYCAAHDLNRSQVVRKALKLLIAGGEPSGAEITLSHPRPRPRAPRPRQTA